MIFPESADKNTGDYEVFSALQCLQCIASEICFCFSKEAMTGRWIWATCIVKFVKKKFQFLPIFLCRTHMFMWPTSCTICWVVVKVQQNIDATYKASTSGMRMTARADASSCMLKCEVLLRYACSDLFIRYIFQGIFIATWQFCDKCSASCRWTLSLPLHNLA